MIRRLPRLLFGILPASVVFLLAAAAAVRLGASADVAETAAGASQESVEEKQIDNALKKYKRRHPAIIEAAVAPNFDKARKRLKKWFDISSDDPENYYALAVVESQAGNVDAATEAIEQALRLGLAPERIVAGTHTLLDRNSPAWKKLAEEYRYRLVSGPMVGVVTPASAKIWTRTAQTSTVKVECSATPDFSEVQATGEAKPTADSDFTSVVELAGLRPGTTYHYRVLVDGREDATRASYQSFTTSPPDGTPTTLRVAFGGCAGYTPMNERMWDTIREARPQALWLLGDNEYLDAPEVPAVQHYCFYRRQARPEFRRLTAGTPVYAIWDDHDFGANDCSGGPEIETPRWKRPVWNIFRHTWLNPSYGGGESRPGCWFDYWYGDIHFIFLDGRYYRAGAAHGVDPPTMLGPEQKQWLFDLLANSQARVTVLVSPVTWALETKGDSPDTWHGFQQERREIFDFLTAHKIPGVVLVSSDRHRSDLLENPREGDYLLHEFNSGLLTNDTAHPVLPTAPFSFNALPSFGLIDFDTASSAPSVTYRIVDVNGVERHAFTVALEDLQ